MSKNARTPHPPPLLFNLASLCAGLITSDSLMQQGSPMPTALAWALSCGALLALIFARRSALTAFRAAALLAFFLGGLTLARPPLTPTPWPPEAMIWEGPIVSAPREVSGGCRLELLLRPTANRAAARVEARIEGGCRGAQEGDGLRFKAAVRPILNHHNPGERDKQARARRGGLAGRVFIAEGAALALLPHRSAQPVHSALVAARQRARAFVTSQAPQHVRGILLALTLGDKSLVDDDTRASFSHSGLAHVLAISGLHVAGLAMALTSAAAALLAFTPLAGSTARLWLASGLGLAAALAYAGLAGFPLSALRALAMATAAMGARAAGRRTTPLAPVGLAALGLLAWRPEDLWDVGFQLSFGSVLALLILGPHIAALIPPALTAYAAQPKLLGALRRLVAGGLGIVSASVAASVGTAPLLTYYFHGVPLMGPIANLAGLTLLGTVAVPCAVGAVAAHLAGVPAAPRALLKIATVAVSMGMEVAAFFGAQGRFPTLSAWPDTLTAAGAGALAMALAAALARQRRWAMLLGGIGLGLMAIGPARSYAPEPSLSLIQIAVGQGDAHLLTLPDGQQWLVDAGGNLFAGSGSYDPGRAIVVPALRSEGVDHLDVVILSHPHPDHMGGLAAVAEEIPIDELWLAAPDAGQFGSRLGALTWRPDSFGAILTQPPDSGGPLADLIRQVIAGGGQVRALQASDGATLGGVDVSVLHPSPGWPPVGARRRSYNLNNGSLTMRLSWGAHRILLTGDLEKEAEAHLVEADPAALRATVLKVPHHGSNTSTTQAFLDAVTPTWALLPVGRNNRFAFPRAEVMERLSAAGVRVLRADHAAYRLVMHKASQRCDRYETGWGWREGGCGEAAGLGGY